MSRSDIDYALDTNKIDVDILRNRLSRVITQKFANLTALRANCSTDPLGFAYINDIRKRYINVGKSTTLADNGTTIIRDANGDFWRIDEGTGRESYNLPVSTPLILPRGNTQVKLIGTVQKTLLLPSARSIASYGEDIFITQDAQSTAVFALLPASGETIIGSDGVDTQPAAYNQPTGANPSIFNNAKYYEPFTGFKSIHLIAFDDGWHDVTEGGSQNVTINNSLIPDPSGRNTILNKDINISTANTWFGSGENVGSIDPNTVVQIEFDDPDDGATVASPPTTIGELMGRSNAVAGQPVDDTGNDADVGFKFGTTLGSTTFDESANRTFSGNINFTGTQFQRNGSEIYSMPDPTSGIRGQVPQLTQDGGPAEYVYYSSRTTQAHKARKVIEVQKDNKETQVLLALRVFKEIKDQKAQQEQQVQEDQVDHKVKWVVKVFKVHQMFQYTFE